MKEYLLDANVLVRFLTQDDSTQGPASVALVERAEKGEALLYLDPLVIAETVFVLTRRYGRNRQDVANVLLAFIQNVGIVTENQDTIVEALRRFAAFNVDYTDAWLAARSVNLGHAIASFDRDYDKFKDIKRFEPIL